MFRHVILGLVLLLVAALPAAAEEYIRNYHSDIRIGADGEVTVAEAITVNAEGDRIRRGIFRDFPLTMEGANGRTIHVDFDVVSVTRDGRQEAFRTEDVSGGIRIYAGSGDTHLSPGEHTYVITYRSSRQIRHFDDHDEFYWNVTGNGWQFRIEKASARVTLPAGRVTQTAVFTGPQGSRASNATKEASGPQATFATTLPLRREQGLTVVVGFPKGIVAPPSAEQQRAWWWRDNLNLFLALGGLVVVFAYYLFVWRRVGRDPKGGTIVPRWDLPHGVSPALVNYIDNKGFSGAGWTAFSASLLDLAVNGYVTLEDLKSRVIVKRTGKTPRNLPVGQAAIIGELGSASREFAIDKANGEKVGKVGRLFRGAMEKEHRGKYYRHNVAAIVCGVLLSVLALLLLLVVGDIDESNIGFLVVPLIFGLFWSFFAVKVAQSLMRRTAIFARILSAVAIAFFGFVGFSMTSQFLVGLVDSLHDGHWPLLIGVTGIVMINAVFFFLMGAPTRLGRRMMDDIEGLRLYLTVAEKDRMNMAGVPQMSPQHFEKLLPYAVALGVEKPWSRAFETWLATAAGVAAASYAPQWYAGDNIGNFGDRIGGFSSSMSSTIASTIPTPKSSSSSSGFSSGGGFSGGGGGGGGGGGW